MDKEALKLIQEMLREELQPIKNDIYELKEGQNRLETGQNQLEVRLDKLETGQEEIKTMISELDPQNANRHLELKSSIDELRRDLSTKIKIIDKS